MIPSELLALARYQGHNGFERNAVVAVYVMRRVLSHYDEEGKPVFLEEWPDVENSTEPTPTSLCVSWIPNYC